MLIELKALIHQAKQLCTYISFFLNKFSELLSRYSGSCSKPLSVFLSSSSSFFLFVQAWANYGPGRMYGPLSLFIRPAEPEEIPSQCFQSRLNTELNTVALQRQIFLFLHCSLSTDAKAHVSCVSHRVIFLTWGGSTKHSAHLLRPNFRSHSGPPVKGFCPPEWACRKGEAVLNCNTRVCERIHVMGVWNSSRQTEHDIIPVFRLLSLRPERQKDRFRTSKKKRKKRTRTGRTTDGRLRTFWRHTISRGYRRDTRTGCPGRRSSSSSAGLSFWTCGDPLYTDGGESLEVMATSEYKQWWETLNPDNAAFQPRDRRTMSVIAG